MIRITACFTGRVQGVGFRYTTTHIARRFAVAGYVMNLPDGRVELVAEGDLKEAHVFIAALKENMGQHITDTKQHTGSATGEFGDPASPKSFTVRY
jgi:acylphosphatase